MRGPIRSLLRQPLKLHKYFASLERLHVLGTQLDPFAVLAFGPEPFVPIRLDTYRIVGLDDMNSVRPGWQLDGQFALPATKRIAMPKFVIVTGFQEIDETDFEVVLQGWLGFFWLRLDRSFAYRGDVIETVMRFAMFQKPRDLIVTPP